MLLKNERANSQQLFFFFLNECGLSCDHVTIVLKQTDVHVEQIPTLEVIFTVRSVSSTFGRQRQMGYCFEKQVRSFSAEGLVVFG